MTKHTPGPWVLDDPCENNPQRAMGGEQIFKVTGCGFGSGLIADVSSWWYSRESAKANARLIAAAPDMLAALEQVLELHAKCERENMIDWQWFDAAYYAARAAIAKARGE